MMTTVFKDEFLTEAVRGKIHDFALQGRDILTREARDLLEGVYGLHKDGSLEAPGNLPALADEEVHTTYTRLKRFLDDEVSAGLERREAVEKLIKEVAFTHLNRLVAFKMLEVRKLTREAVGRGPDSNGFKFYLADHAEDAALWQSGKVEQAYRHFLLWQAGQIALEIRVLFDPEDLASRLFPRPPALGNVLALLNDPDLAPAWRTEETTGWIYQFFSEQEKSDVFDRLFKQKKKIRRQNIPAATQLFTPRWIVRFIVENTLGRLWVQMHPDSRLKDTLGYLVPLPGETPVEPLRPAREITLLDPACGTMHFGLVAFDIFVEMYREELERAGNAGWLESPSISSEEEIPSAIVQHNLFGIDIDLRAVQLSALTLYLKAKGMNKHAEVSDHNLASADVLALNGARLGTFIRELQFRPIYERLLRKLWERLEDLNQLGSLLRLEKAVSQLIEEERARYEREGRQLDMFRNVVTEFESEAARQEYWDVMADQIIQALDFFGRAMAERGLDERFFTREAAKGLQVLDLMLRRYDCVVANPPYMSRRNLNSALADFLADQYPEAKGDLYAAFIVRCGEFTRELGRVGMITQQSFMFISSYEKLRTSLLEQFAVETMAHTGPRAFAEISGEKVNTTMFVLRKEPDATRRANSVGTYFRLVHEPDAEAKRLAFEKALVELKQIEG